MVLWALVATLCEAGSDSKIPSHSGPGQLVQLSQVEAEAVLGVSPLLDSGDFQALGPEQNSVMTYLSCLRGAEAQGTRGASGMSRARLRVKGSGLDTTRVAGSVGVIEVWVESPAGKAIAAPQVSFTVSGDTVQHHMEASIDTDDVSHVQRIEYTCFEALVYTLELSIEGIQGQAEGFPLDVHVVAGDAVPSACQLVGGIAENPRAGKDLVTQVILKDAYGNLGARGRIEVTKDGRPVPVDARGHFTLRYETPVSGSVVRVTVDGKEVRGSPFHLEVQGPEPPAQTQLLTAPPAVLHLGVEEVFTAQALDALGRLVPAAGHPYLATLEGGRAVVRAAAAAAQEGQATGLLEVALYSERPGPAQLVFSLAGVPLAGFPRTVTVAGARAKDWDPRRSTFTVRPLRLVAGQRLTVEMDPRDAFGNPIDEDDDAEVEWSFGVHPAREPVRPEPEDDRDHALTFPLTVAGTYTVRATSDCKGSPAEVVVVPAEVDPDQCEVLLAGESIDGDAEAAVDRDTAVTVVLRDRYRNLIQDDSEQGARSQRLVAVSVPAPHRVDHAQRTVRFTELGPAALTVTIDGRPLPGCPMTVAVSAGELPARTAVTATAAAGEAALDDGRVVAGEEATLRLVALDAAGAQQRSGRQPYAADFGPSGRAAVADRLDGSYQVTFASETAGAHTLSLTLAGRELPGFPRTITVVPAAADATRSLLSGPASAPRGAVTRFALDQRDRFGNKIPALPLAAGWRLVADPPADPGAHPLELSFSRGGTHAVRAELAGARTDPPVVIQVSSAASAAHTKVHLAGGPFRSGRPVTGRIEPRDSHGPLVAGDSHQQPEFEFAVRVTAPGHASFPVVTPTDTSFSFLPEEAGVYVVAVSLVDDEAETELDGGPWQVVVEPGPVDLDKSVFRKRDDGADISDSVAPGASVAFVVLPRDAYGNRVSGAALQFRLRPGPAHHHHAHAPYAPLAQRPDGSLEGAFCVEQAGPAVLEIATADLEQVRPFELVAATGTLASFSTCSGLPAGAVEVGTTHEVTIKARSHTGPVLVGGDAFSFQVSAGGAASTAVALADRGDGSYVGSWTPTEVGPHSLTVALSGSALSGMPREVQVVPGPCDASRCVASGPGLEGAEADSAAIFQVSCMDSRGNLRAGGGDTVTVLIVRTASASSTKDLLHGGSSGSLVVGTDRRRSESSALDCTVVDNLDGTYKCAYLAESSGVYSMTVFANGQAIRGSPFRLEVAAGRVSAAMTALDVVSDAKGDARLILPAGKPASLTVRPRDAAGNGVHTAEQLELEVTLRDAQGRDLARAVTYRPGPADMYAVTFTPHLAGACVVHVKLFGVHVKGSPLQLLVETGPLSPKRCSASSAAFTKVVLGKPYLVRVALFDDYGNPRASPEDGELLEVEHESPAPPRQQRLKADRDGTFTVNVVVPASPDRPAATSLAVRVRGEHIQGSPFAMGKVLGVCPHCEGEHPGDRFAAHEAECPLRPHTCRHCGEEMKLGNKKKHDAHCPKRKTKCELCGEPVLVIEYLQHKRGCKLAEEARHNLTRLEPVVGVLVVTNPATRSVVVKESKKQAFTAGIREGDRITSVAGTPTATKEAFGAVIKAATPGDTLRFDVVRAAGGTQAYIDVEIGDARYTIDQVRKWRRHAEGRFEEADFVMAFSTK